MIPQNVFNLELIILKLLDSKLANVFILDLNLLKKFITNG